METTIAQFHFGIVRGGGGGMMVKDVTKFHKCHLGGCLNVRVGAGFHRGL